MNRFSVVERFTLGVWAALCVGMMLYAIGAKTVHADRLDVPAYVAPGPYDAQQDTFMIATGDTMGRAVNITGAVRLGLYVPTIDATDLKLWVGYNADSTFVQPQITSADSLKVLSLHNGTGLFGVDLTDIVTGFSYFKIETGDTMTADRTFHYTIKY